MMKHRDQFAHREGRTITLPVGDDRIVTGIVAPRDSEPAKAGEDLLFRACSRDCDRALRSAVPRAMRKWFKVGGDASSS